MPFIIDAHEDLACAMAEYQRDYNRSAAETRRLEENTLAPQRNGQTLLGWPDYQQGQVGLVIATLFQAPARYGKPWDTQVFKDTRDSRRNYQLQLDLYRRLADQHPDHFKIVKDKSALVDVLRPWLDNPADYPTLTHPVGLVISMEGVEGIESPREMEEWWEAGARLAGPVWAGTRWCGGTREHGGFTSEGRELLAVMADIGYILDVSHMDDPSVREALDRYEGPVIASHANCRALFKHTDSERQLTDEAIRRLVDRDGVMGVVPFNVFLVDDWKAGDDRRRVTLDHVVAHIDHICQIAGDARHAAIGTDFDGGFGWPEVPLEINTIADLPKLEGKLKERGYTADEINGIFHGNWQRILETHLPSA